MLVSTAFSGYSAMQVACVCWVVVARYGFGLFWCQKKSLASSLHPEPSGLENLWWTNMLRSSDVELPDRFAFSKYVHFKKIRVFSWQLLETWNRWNSMVFVAQNNVTSVFAIVSVWFIPRPKNGSIVVLEPYASKVPNMPGKLLHHHACSNALVGR